MKTPIKILLLSSSFILATTIAYAQTQGASTPLTTGTGGANGLHTDQVDTGANASGTAHMKQTTGSGAQSESSRNSPAKESSEKNKSPASLDAGIKQEK
jgi:hypothetical protein